MSYVTSSENFCDGRPLRRSSTPIGPELPAPPPLVPELSALPPRCPFRRLEGDGPPPEILQGVAADDQPNGFADALANLLGVLGRDEPKLEGDEFSCGHGSILASAGSLPAISAGSPPQILRCTRGAPAVRR